MREGLAQYAVDIGGRVVSISWKIPRSARYIATANIFSAAFNVPALGQYDFGVAGNQNAVVLPLQPNSVYLLERMSVSGDISEENYTDALDLSVADRLPRLSLRRLLDGASVYETPLMLPGYVSQQESSAWVLSARSGDALTATLTGRLNQTAPLVGRAFVRLTVSFSVYAIESTIYMRAFLDSQGLDLGDLVARS